MQDNLEVRSNLQEAMSTTTALAVVDRITTLALSAFNARVKYEELAAVVEGERSKRRDAERIAAQAQEQMRGARESTLQFANERDKAFKAREEAQAGEARVREALAAAQDGYVSAERKLRRARRDHEATRRELQLLRAALKAKGGKR
jgi:hypothetical protein